MSINQFSAAKDYLRKTMPLYYTTTVVLSSVTYSNSNTEADETATVTGTASLNCYIVRKSRPWNFDKSGFIEGGDAILLAAYDSTIKRGDIITWNSNQYRIQTVLDRDQLTGAISYKACNLFKI